MLIGYFCPVKLLSELRDPWQHSFQNSGSQIGLLGYYSKAQKARRPTVSCNVIKLTIQCHFTYLPRIVIYTLLIKRMCIQVHSGGLLSFFFIHKDISTPWMQTDLLPHTNLLIFSPGQQVNCTNPPMRSADLSMSDICCLSYIGWRALRKKSRKMEFEL